MLRNILSSKIFIVSLISLLLIIPLSLISEKIDERNRYFQQAKNSVSQSWTGSQTIVGPLIVIPYKIKTTSKVWNKETNEHTLKTSKLSRKSLLLPHSIKIDSSVTVDNRYKGIYKIPVYTTLLKLNGAIDSQLIIKELDRINKLENLISVDAPFLSVTVSDPRGINSIPVLSWGEREINFNPGSKLSANNNGIHAVLPKTKSDTQSKTPFDFQLEIRGMETLSFVPVGQQADVQISSLWPHPEFTGKFLPISRVIDETGYRAQWKITSFASNIVNKVKHCEQGNCKGLFSSHFGVRHIEPVDIYLQSERSVKYALLFIGLSFIAFFIFEVMKKLPIHAVQYTLVGFAISVFYLLLFSLSEHIAFALAYLISTLSCVSLLLFYLSYVLRGFRQAGLFASLLLLLYGVLYVIISAEDYALLMGSVLAFSTLAIVMAITRNIDWQAEGEARQ